MTLKRASTRNMATHPHTQMLVFLCRQLGCVLQGILSCLWAWFELCLAALDAIFSVLSVLMEPKNFQLRFVRWERPARFRFQVDSFTSSTDGSFFVSASTVIHAEHHRSVQEAMGGLTQDSFTVATERHESGESMQLSPIGKKHYQSYTFAATALERKEERFLNTEMMIVTGRRKSGSDRMDMQHSKEDFSDFPHVHEISQSIATNNASASLCEEVCTTRCLTRVEEVVREPSVKGSTLFFLISDAARSQNMSCSIPFQAHSFLQPLHSLGLENFSTQRYEPGWGILLDSRLETAVEGDFSEFRQGQKDATSLIKQGGSSYALTLKGRVVTWRNNMRGLSVKYMKSGSGSLTLGTDWLMGLALITRWKAIFHIRDLNKARCIYSFTPRDGLIKALHVDEGLLTFAGDSPKEKGAFSMSFRDSKMSTKSVGVTRVLQGNVQGLQYTGYELYVHNAQNSTSVRMLGASTLRIKRRTNETDEKNSSDFKRKIGMEAVDTELVCSAANKEVEKANETTQFQQDTLWDIDAVCSAANKELEMVKETTQSLQDTWWDADAVSSVANEEVEKAKETTQLQQDTWWDTDAVVLTSDGEDLADDFAQEWITVGKEDANAETEETVLSLSVSAVRSVSSASNM